MIGTFFGWFGLESGSARSPVPLLAALVGVASTLVAITGGLLVSRLAALASQRVSARQAVDAAEAAETTCRTQLEACESAVRGAAVDLWIANAVPALVNSRGTVGVGRQYLLAQQTFDHDPALLDEPLAQARRVLGEAFDEIQQVAPDTLWPQQWATARQRWRMQHDPAKDHLYEAVYAALAEARERERYHADVIRREREFARRRAAGEAAGLASLRQPVEPRPIERPRFKEHLQALHERSRTAAAALGPAQDRHVEAQSAVRLARQSLTAAQTPPNTQGALAFLLYMAVVGIALPLTLLAFEPTQIDLGWRIALPSLFAIGLAGLFWVLYAGLRPEKPGSPRTRPLRARRRPAPAAAAPQDPAADPPPAGAGGGAGVGP